jgi:DNA-binding response OmpR family regulator
MEPTGSEKQEINQNRESDLAGLRILIVEDMGMVAQRLKWMLEKESCHIVDVVSRLDDAAKLARSERLDGVLLDLNLSGEISYPVAEILHDRGIPFIIMTGYESSQIRADCASDAHLQKPFTDVELAAMMRRTFRLGKAG